MVWDDNVTVAGSLAEGIRLSIACHESQIRELMSLKGIVTLHFRTKDTWREEDAELDGVLVIKPNLAHKREISDAEFLESVQNEIRQLTRYNFRPEFNQRASSRDLS